MKTIATILHNKTFPLNILDSKDNLIYFESSIGYWEKRLFDSNAKEIYYESSNGFLIDNRS